MNNFIEKASTRRSIRFFTDEKIKPETLDKIFYAMLQSASSNVAQQCSVIRVSDPEKKRQISEISMQPYIAKVPELLIFISDIHRNMELVKESGLDPESRKSDIDVFMQSVTDASIMAQNTANIVESLGFGSVFLGSILNDAEKLIEILGLPKLTFPVVGLAFGHPNQEPPTKPKLPVEFRVFENTYKTFDNYTKTLSDYNETTKAYYAIRQKTGEKSDFFGHILFSFEHANPKRSAIFEMAKRNGYKL